MRLVSDQVLKFIAIIIAIVHGGHAEDQKTCHPRSLHGIRLGLFHIPFHIPLNPVIFRLVDSLLLKAGLHYQNFCDHSIAYRNFT
jgi:hypothetical protein